MTEIAVALASVLGAAIAAFVSWRVAKRTSSGSIDTSQAASLWREGTSLRDYLTTQVTVLRDRLAESNTLSTRLLHELELANVAADASRDAADAAKHETQLARAETARLLAAVQEVHQEVRTGNAQTLGALADQGESRRIALIPLADRTKTERDHIDTVGLQDQSSGSGPQ